MRRQEWKSATASATVGGIFDGAGQGGAVPTLSAYTPEERITVEQAIRAYTMGSAYARFSEDSLGSLETGKFADLAVLSQDVFRVSPDKISDTHVVMTMVGGKIVFTQPGEAR